MKRREVIKKIGFSFGAATLTPSLLGVLNGCDFKEEGWQPKFLSLQEYEMTEKITDIFIPSTEIPGAKELNLTRFIDCLLYTSPSPRDGLLSRMPSSA